eukprot:34199-Eustigmatos_ZCMA.PRE.1
MSNPCDADILMRSPSPREANAHTCMFFHGVCCCCHSLRSTMRGQTIKSLTDTIKDDGFQSLARLTLTGSRADEDDYEVSKE